jgi:putative oxidoreductase
MMRKNFGKLFLRVALGVLILLHGVHKLLNGIGDIKQMLAGHGLPDVLAYGVYLGEILGPILIIVGIFTRIGGALIAINMAVAVALAGMGSLLALDPKFGGYALELEAMYFFAAVGVAMIGAGGYSLGGKDGRFN